MIDVTEEDGCFTISWDENDPVERNLNNWTEDDFIDAILSMCLECLEESESEAIG